MATTETKRSEHVTKALRLLESAAKLLIEGDVHGARAVAYAAHDAIDDETRAVNKETVAAAMKGDK